MFLNVQIKNVDKTQLITAAIPTCEGQTLFLLREISRIHVVKDFVMLNLVRVRL